MDTHTTTSSSRRTKQSIVYQSQSERRRKSLMAGGKKKSSIPPRDFRRYARKPITFEFSRSRTVHVVICALVASQAVVGASLLIGGSVALFYCADVSFAGYTPVTGGIYLIASVAMGYYTYIEQRLYCLIASIVSFFIAVLLSVSEFMSVHCINSNTPEKPPCVGFLVRANLCIWVMDVTAGVLSDIPDSFYGGRVGIVFLSILAVMLSVATTISFFISEQSSGRAVYLYHKRNKAFYVVGDLSNVALAFDNEEKNVAQTAATPREAKLYDARRSSFTVIKASALSSPKSVQSDTNSSHRDNN